MLLGVTFIGSVVTWTRSRLVKSEQSMTSRMSYARCWPRDRVTMA